MGQQLCPHQSKDQGGDQHQLNDDAGDTLHQRGGDPSKGGSAGRKDPSLHNWLGLAIAVRSEGISDFPINNKSFNLSYCGHDL